MDTEADCRHCRPDCSGTEYMVSQSEAELRWQHLQSFFTIYLWLLFCRPCDSHNLNTNPLCDLTDTAGIRPWARAVKEEYGKKDVPYYITSLEDPYRKLYPDPITKAGELLTKKAKEDSEYDAFKEDIAILNIYFGKSTALGKNYFPAFFNHYSIKFRV